MLKAQSLIMRSDVGDFVDERRAPRNTVPITARLITMDLSPSVFDCRVPDLSNFSKKVETSELTHVP